METVRLQSSDGDIFDVDVDVAKLSITIKNMLEDFLVASDAEDEPVPLANVNTPTLRKVIAWCTHHKDDDSRQEMKVFEGASKQTGNISPWDAEFLKMEQPDLFDLILAANFLDIDDLLDLTCKAVANMIIGKSTEEIRKTFNIKNDLSPEEEEKIRSENSWCANDDIIVPSISSFHRYSGIDQLQDRADERCVSSLRQLQLN